MFAAWPQSAIKKLKLKLKTNLYSAIKSEDSEAPDSSRQCTQKCFHWQKCQMAGQLNRQTSAIP